MDKYLHTGTILIDLEKKFDTLDHDVLLKKVDCIEFEKTTINCLSPTFLIGTF